MNNFDTVYEVVRNALLAQDSAVYHDRPSEAPKPENVAAEIVNRLGLDPDKETSVIAVPDDTHIVTWITLGGKQCCTNHPEGCKEI